MRFEASASPAHPTRLGAFLRQLGEARLATWYFCLINLLTFSLVLLAERKSLTRHLWMVAGLWVGTVLGGLGLWETLAKAPLKEKEAEREALFTGGDYFALGGLSSFLNLIFTWLGVLAPLSLVMLPIVMIAPLSQHEEAAALTAVTSTLPEIVQTNHSVSGLPPCLYCPLR